MPINEIRALAWQVRADAVVAVGGSISVQVLNELANVVR
jgi:hypothetical protein